MRPTFTTEQIRVEDIVPGDVIDVSSAAFYTHQMQPYDEYARTPTSSAWLPRRLDIPVGIPDWRPVHPLPEGDLRENYRSRGMDSLSPTMTVLHAQRVDPNRDEPVLDFYAAVTGSLVTAQRRYPN